VQHATPEALSRVLFSDGELDELARRLESHAHAATDGQRRAALAQLRHDVEVLTQLPKRERGAMLANLQNRLSWFLEPPFLSLCSRSDFSMADVNAGKRIAFVLSTGRFSNTAAPIGRVALSQFKNAVLASGPQVTKIAVLDEFHNFVSPDFVAFLNQARSKGGGAVMALQTLTSLATGARSRQELEAFMANLSTIIVTPGCQPADAAYWAEAFGQEPRRHTSYTYEAPSPFDRRRAPVLRIEEREEYRHTPTQISELPERYALIKVTAGRRSYPVAKVDIERG